MEPMKAPAGTPDQVVLQSHQRGFVRDHARDTCGYQAPGESRVKLQGQVALVTLASRGIGCAMLGSAAVSCRVKKSELNLSEAIMSLSSPALWLAVYHAIVHTRWRYG
jgi:hypothetical protein